MLKFAAPLLEVRETGASGLSVTGVMQLVFNVLVSKNPTLF